MSKSYKSNISKEAFFKLQEKHTGWIGEGIWKSKTKSWWRRVCNKSNRRFYKKQVMNQICSYDEIGRHS